MANAELHIVVFDDKTAQREGARVSTAINVDDISNAQLHALVVLAERTASKLKEFEDMRKTGVSPDQGVTGVEGAVSKTATPAWTADDDRKLEEENTEVDDDPASRLRSQPLP